MKVLMITIALMMMALVGCDRKSPETKLKEQRMEVNKDFREDVHDTREDLNKETDKTIKQRMEDKKEYREDMNKAVKERKSELNEAKKDYIEDVD